MTLNDLAERGFLPDWLIRIGIRRLLRQRLRQSRELSVAQFADWIRQQPTAVATDLANAQHYEVPASFFQAVLGPRLKYSCCLFETADRALAEAEDAMLDLTCRRAEISDDMDILDLGCGWGAFSLWVAERYPRCRITAVSNSGGQRRFIEARCREKGFRNVEVVTANVARFSPSRRYDRIVSVEMFEHFRNYESLLQRVCGWLRPEGKLFVHIFCHRQTAYAFELDGDGDWMARHFFTGGIMPAFDLFDHFDRDLRITQRWFVDGQHYARTCQHWLQNLDAVRSELAAMVQEGKDSAIALQRWRLFFMACAELFGFGNGKEWGVGHYLFEPVRCFAEATP